jgi:hypothetical protein
MTTVFHRCAGSILHSCCPASSRQPWCRPGCKITGQTGAHPIFQNAAGFDLKLTESRTFDGGIQELTYQPALHT